MGYPSYFRYLQITLVVAMLSGILMSILNHESTFRKAGVENNSRTTSTASYPFPAMTITTNKGNYDYQELDNNNNNHHHTKQEQVMKEEEDANSFCLDIDHDLDHLVASSKQLYVTMPAKAAGSSLKKLFEQCISTAYPDMPPPPDNLIEHDIKTFFLTNYQIPSFIASHVGTSQTMIQLIRHATPNSLIVYLYRNEFDRLMSAINHVASVRICKKIMKSDALIFVNETDCILDEKELVEKHISPRHNEIGMGNYRLLTCETYRILDEFQPTNVVFLHYQKANALQELILKYHCSNNNNKNSSNNTTSTGNNDNEAMKPLYTNLSKDRVRKVYIRLDTSTSSTESDSNGNSHTSLVNLYDWLDAKRETIAFMLNLYHKEGNCVGRTKRIEHDLMECPDHAIHVRGGER